MNSDPGNHATERPMVSVIIPVYNNADTLGPVLAALNRQRYPRERFEVIVADNNSTDGSPDVATAHGAVVVFERDRQGSYAARNKGVAAARGDILAFLDGDCRPDEGWLSEAVAVFTETGADLVGGRIAIEAQGGSELLAAYERLSYVRQEDTIARHGTAAGGNLFIHRRVIDTIGPFRQELKSGGDGEICLRAKRAGFTIAYADRAVVAHKAIGSVTALLKRYHRLGRGEADLAAFSVAPIREPGSTPLSRKRDYVRRVWAEKRLSAGARLAIVFLNLAASVAQLIGGRRA